MKEFFLILFFAKSIVLTPEPIDIVGSISLKFAEPVSAITSGARIRIDVTGSLPGSIDRADLVSVLDYLRDRYPDGSVEATLTTSAGKKAVLDRVSGSANAENVELILSSSSGMPTDVDYSAVKIVSTTELRGVRVTWQNYSK